MTGQVSVLADSTFCSGTAAVQVALQQCLATICTHFHIISARAPLVLQETGLWFAVSKEGWGDATA